MNTVKLLLQKLHHQRLSAEEALYLYKNASLNELIFCANEVRKQMHPNNHVGWIIDRNINITNVCISQCKFCNFCTTEKKENAFVTTMDQYKEKIEELFVYGGNQILLQGGMHPNLGLDFYVELFTSLKKTFPDLKLHALGPPEVVYLAQKENLNYTKVLQVLCNAGLDSLPGAGAEILCDRVRKLISPAKCTADEWLSVMRAAHNLNLPTSATMMLGHVETIEERIEHLKKIRDVQDEKPPNAYGFLSFIPWPFQHTNTVLNKTLGVENVINAAEYIRFVAVSRLLLDNITNIQASWLTVGLPVAQICLHAGANDLGSVMMEENVVSVAGANHKTTKEALPQAIINAGFKPYMRNQKFEYI